MKCAGRVALCLRKISNLRKDSHMSPSANPFKRSRISARVDRLNRPPGGGKVLAPSASLPDIGSVSASSRSRRSLILIFGIVSITARMPFSSVVLGEPIIGMGSITP